MVSLTLTFVIYHLSLANLVLRAFCCCIRAVEHLSDTEQNAPALMFSTPWWCPIAALHEFPGIQTEGYGWFFMATGFLEMFIEEAAVNLNHCVIFLCTLGRCYCRFVEF